MKKYNLKTDFDPKTNESFPFKGPIFKKNSKGQNIKKLELIVQYIFYTQKHLNLK